MQKSLKLFVAIILGALAFAWSGDSTSPISPEQSLPKESSEPDSLKKAAQGLNAAWITLEGDVDPAMNDYVRRAIAEARAGNPDVIVFEINTFGGRLDAAFNIVDTITAIHDIPTVALVRQKAISAGALIALSCRKLYMMPSTTIGDCAPILQSQEGPQILGEKIQSPLRAKFRNLAQRNGYPELLSEAMVTPELEVLRLSNADTSLYMESTQFATLTDPEKEVWTSRKTVVRNGELLTLTNEEADSLGFSQQTVHNGEALQKVLGIQSVHKVEISWAEKLASLIGSFSAILLIVGFGALYMEFKTPGFGIFGIVGILALGILFAGQYASHLHDKLPLLLLLLGIILLFVEFVLFPGTLLAGIAGAALLIAALVLTFQDAQIPSFVPDLPSAGGDMPWLRGLIYITGCALAALVVPIFATKYLVPRLPEGYTPVLAGDMASAHSPVSDSIRQLKMGDEGVAHSPLRPTGKAMIGGHLVDVQSRFAFVDAGKTVRVEAIEGSVVWVVEA